MLESHGKPVSNIEMTSKSVEIDGSNYELNKSIKLSGDKIRLHTTSITIDEDGDIEQSSSESGLARSESKLSLHGIEVPTTLFPES